MDNFSTLSHVTSPFEQLLWWFRDVTRQLEGPEQSIGFLQQITLGFSAMMKILKGQKKLE